MVHLFIVFVKACLDAASGRVGFQDILQGLQRFHVFWHLGFAFLDSRAPEKFYCSSRFREKLIQAAVQKVFFLFEGMLALNVHVKEEDSGRRI